MYKLEKEIDIPKIEKSHRSWRYPIDDMEIGDSFLVPWLDDKPEQVARRVRGSITAAKKRHPTWNFTVRLAYDEKGIRVWRTKPKPKPAPQPQISDLGEPARAPELPPDRPILVDDPLAGYYGSR